MIIVWRRFRHNQATGDDDGAEDIRQRFDGIGDQGLGMSEYARQKFGRSQADVGGKAEQRRTQTALQAEGGHNNILGMRNHNRNQRDRFAAGIHVRDAGGVTGGSRRKRTESGDPSPILMGEISPKQSSRSGP